MFPNSKQLIIPVTRVASALCISSCMAASKTTTTKTGRNTDWKTNEFELTEPPHGSV